MHRNKCKVQKNWCGQWLSSLQPVQKQNNKNKKQTKLRCSAV